jgi:4-amino-4-deoxy-L-arabinose transferase-like glycosyltransferase
MAETTATIMHDDVPQSFSDKKTTSLPIWHWPALVVVLLISAWMNFYQLGQNGFGNQFYAAGVRSMLDSWHNFFFVSYDPGGFVTIDKPALGFWLQTLSAKVFGFTPFSIFFPQALAGILAVLLLYHLVRRHFGGTAGLLAALLLALSPISVVTNRNNTIDSTLALVLLLGAWAVLRAAETGRLRWLLLSAALVGLGFNVKMMEAYLVLPAFGVLYLLAAPKKLWVRIGHLALALVVLLVISFSWALAVDMTPASQRPYVGSSQTNSEVELAVGYNGINRLIGGFGRGRGNNTQSAATRRPQTTADNTASGNTPAAPGTGERPGGGFGAGTGERPGGGFGAGNGQTGRGRPQGGLPGFGTGTASPFRLFTSQLGGQIAWFLPLALFGLIALAVLRRPRFQSDRQQQSLLLWGMWLLTMAGFFSVASMFHLYYMTEMAPGIAALGGIGLVVMWNYFRLPGWRRWLLPLALVATAAEQIYLLQNYSQWGWLVPLIAVLTALAVLALVVVASEPRLRRNAKAPRFLLPAIGLGVLALLFAPAIWAALPVLANVENSSPSAGPVSNGFGGQGASGRRQTTGSEASGERQTDARFAQGGGFGGGFGGGNAGVNTALVKYLEARQGSTKFLVAVPSSMSADSIILSTNKPVMAMGGFSGGDPILTTSSLQTLIKNGTVRFFLLNAPRTNTRISDAIPAANQALANFFGGNRQSSTTTWVTQHCATVPASAWQSSSSATNGSANSLGGNQLYDCSTLK